MAKERVWAVIVAAGSGSRFGGPKQFTQLGGRAVLCWSLETARKVCAGVVLVLPPEGFPLGWQSGDLDADATVVGGKTRSASVREGLCAVPQSAEIIVVHDAARPLASAGLFTLVLEALADGADGAIPVLPIPDTVKRLEGERVAATIDRSGLVLAQTPQAFLSRSLRTAHQGWIDSTDDASLVEAAGGTVVAVPGEPQNLKLTTPADLEVLEALASRYKLR